MAVLVSSYALVLLLAVAASVRAREARRHLAGLLAGLAVVAISGVVILDPISTATVPLSPPLDIRVFRPVGAPPSNLLRVTVRPDSLTVAQTVRSLGDEAPLMVLVGSSTLVDDAIANGRSLFESVPAQIGSERFDNQLVVGEVDSGLGLRSYVFAIVSKPNAAVRVLTDGRGVSVGDETIAFTTPTLVWSCDRQLPEIEHEGTRFVPTCPNRSSVEVFGEPSWRVEYADGDHQIGSRRIRWERDGPEHGPHEVLFTDVAKVDRRAQQTTLASVALGAGISVVFAELVWRRSRDGDPTATRQTSPPLPRSVAESRSAVERSAPVSPTQLVVLALLVVVGIVSGIWRRWDC